MEKGAVEEGLQEEWQEGCGHAGEAGQARGKGGCIEA